MWYYKYDALGRRISKECPQQHLRIEYLWDGDQLTYTQTFKNGKLDSQRHSVFNGWQLLAQQDSYQQLKQTIDGNFIEWKQETGYAICQPNGQVLALLNPKGRTLWRKEKQTLWGLCFANEYKQPNPLDPQILFAGQWIDEESGLAYNRFRYYDPESGNYISSDPIGLAGGETPYSYVHNVLDFLDPFGLAKCPKLPSTDGGLSQVQKNKKIGDKVRDEIARERGVITVEKVMKTSSGKIRRIDVYDDIHGAKIGIESKVGRTSLTSRTRQELARDITLMREGKLDGIEWVFTRSPITGKIGPTAALESKLNKFGIPIIYR